MGTCCKETAATINGDLKWIIAKTRFWTGKTHFSLIFAMPDIPIMCATPWINQPLDAKR
jgi:hypothetical protein